MTAWNAADLQVCNTLPKILRHNAQQNGKLIAMREKDFGIWNNYTWADVYDHVSNMAAAMWDMGVRPGDVVGILGDNRPNWIWAELSAHAIGAMSLGVYQESLVPEVQHLLDLSEAKVIFTEDEEQTDKILDMGEDAHYLQRIVYADDRGMGKYTDPRLISLEDFEKIGAAVRAQNPNLIDELINATNEGDCAILCTTSGTTSAPKMSMLPHRSIIGHCANYLIADPKAANDEYVSVLPLPWIMEQVYAVGKFLMAGMRVNFVEDTHTTWEDFREIGPTFVLLAPRVWEQIAADIQAKIMDSTPLKRWMYTYFSNRAMKTYKETGKTDKLADFFLLSALRDRLGFSNLTSAATGGAPMGPDTFNFFQAMGVPLKQLYGQTETLGAYTLHRAHDIDYETVGVPFDGVEVHIDNPDAQGLGEIVARHPYMMSGYFKNDKATEETITKDGWLYTGDAGYMDNKGHLVVVDRIKDMMTTATGIRFSPAYIENKLKFSPYVAEAVILGDNREHLTAIICIRLSTVSKWAEGHRINYTTYSDLSSKPQVQGLIQKEVDQVNKVLPDSQTIKRFILLYKELDADDGELTRTRKVRRGVVAEKYADIIETLYSDADHVEIDTVINFQDGSKQRIQTTLKVLDMAS